MTRFFNTSGPCRPSEHYLLDPLSRLADIRTLIEKSQYFVVHAPRQTGKTTTLEALAAQLTAEGKYTALRFSCETGRAFGGDVGRVEAVVVEALLDASDQNLSPDLQCPKPPRVPRGTRLKAVLRNWAKTSPRPLVLFIDEIDAITDESLISVLHQLRDGYTYRPKNFPHSIVLCGLRDVRDYKVLSGGEPRLGTASPFNIKSESLRLENFTEAEVAELLTQHTTETGQIFEPEALSKTWELTEGQPWLVNALANHALTKMRIPITQSITSLDIERAAQDLITARQTHLDSLVDKLQETRVRNVIEPAIAGTMTTAEMTYDDDVSYVRDLGLIAMNDPVRISNPIYREVIARVLVSRASGSIILNRKSYVNESGYLDVSRILEEFAVWWSENADFMLSSTYYNEAAAQLVFMAWLQRVVNGGGMIDREYGVGRGRIDILVRWPHPSATSPREWQKEAFELKVWKDGRPDPLSQGLVQLESYLDRLNLTSGTLVIFDRRKDALPPPERICFEDAKTEKGHSVRVLRG